ncbi:4-hydroxy-tetrahydrodipicolinate reductase [Aurantibacillus circumpalustris]|uniref:4-hydroxy-tetrahydrodipicolinate reductase n=1 Tax=Aurantibacillus circumpalustris TaxID=3036359 RepID=UPI00295AC55A|nr:4-hydroxy-tetrahydrodipicolinate reductase [Aurantibacillus circumpalustris]
MNIALIGYGKMGKEIEAIAIKRGHSVVLKIDKDNSETITMANLKKADVAIEFSTPHTVLENIERCFDANLPIVVGTTGWYDYFDKIKKDCDQKQGSLFHATNFSLGVNLFFKVNTYLAALMDKYDDYEVSMEEIHHIHKLDKPSGTAITLANQAIDKIKRKKKWSIDSKDSETLFINDLREGEVPGTHIMKYHSAIDDIEIMHKAHNRKGFALGAVIAAEFLNGKKGIYTMNDII